MPTRALVALGIGQCVNWGVLYYAFAVLVIPLQRELAVETWVVTGAFSLALLISAALAPAVGRWGDRDRGPFVMQTGGVAGAILLGVWTFLPGVPALYLVWSGLGLCMAATLYEPAFVIIGRAHADPADRLRALAAVTLLGGLASTAFLPVTAVLVSALEWRWTVLALAAVLGLSTWLTRVLVFRRLTAGSAVGDPSATTDLDRRERDPRGFVAVAGMFTLTTFAGAGLVTNLVPVLGERGLSSERAAVLGAVMGAMQLPGRALLMNRTFGASPSSLLALSLALHAAGLALVAFGPAPVVVGIGSGVFALGAGLTTLVRPHLIQTMYRAESGGALNGRVARQQQFARAAGPILIAWLASRLSYRTVLAALAATFVFAGVASQQPLIQLAIGKWRRRPYDATTGDS